MRPLFLLLIVCCLSVADGFAIALEPDPPSRPAGFIPNKGQVKNERGLPADNVILSTEANGQQLYVTTQGFTYVFNKTEAGANNTVLSRRWRVNMTLRGASVHRDSVEWLDVLDGPHYNYYYAHCPSGVTGVQAYHALRIRNAYPGVDWYIEKTENGIKHNFELKPNADPAQIKMDYSGARTVKTDADGRLIVSTPCGTIEEAPPVSLQQGKEIASRYMVHNGLVTFEIGKYNKTQPLVIDPTLKWGTVFGGFLSDEFRSIVYDNTGRLIATGFSSSPDFPVMSVGTYYTDTLTGAWTSPRSDVVIVKFNANHNVQWATYYGGNNQDGLECGYAVAVDAANNLFVSGVTSSDNFPVQSGGAYHDSTLDGSSDGFLIKFSPTGARIFATLVGGDGDDFMYDICIDAANNVYACGYTNSTTFPLQANGVAYFNSTAASGNGFVAKFSNGGALDWSTFFGGSNQDECRSIATDGVNVYTTGFTHSLDFPIVNNGTFFQSQLNNGSGAATSDMFVGKFGVGGALEWSTYYGGSSSDYGMQVTTASGGFVFLLGATRSVNFPTQNYNATSFFDSQLNNGDTIHYDAGLVKFKDDGSQLWSTYFGGDDDDVRLPFQPLAYMNDQLKADACGNVYGSFVTKSAGLPATNPLCDSYVDGLRGGQRDAFVMQFTRQQKLRWSSYYGGSGEENGLALALDKKNNLTVCGNTDPGTGLPIEVMPLAYNSNSIDSIDAFFGKLVQPTFTPAVTTALCSGACSGEATVAINSLCTATGYAFNWSTGASGNAATGLCAGNYSVTITDTLNCVVDTVDVNITSGITIEPVVDAMSCNFACTGYASVSVPGATSLTYQWSNSTTNAYAAALCPGNYSVTVTAPGCGSDAASFAIVLPPNLEISLSSIEPTCGLSCTAGASVVITGGQTLPYITWDNGVVGPVATNLCPNETYIITASDSLCYSATYVLNVPVAYMTGDIEGINGCGCDNARTVEVYNATNYEIQWSTGDTTATVYNLCPGIYSVTITDSLCGTLVLIDTVIPVPTPYVHNIHSEFAGCPDSCNVLISVKIGPPLPGGGYYQYPGPISMQWTDTAGNPVYGLKCVGETYFFTWTNGCGDTLTGSVTPFPNYLLSASLQVLDYTCPGSCDGVLEVDSIYNGTPPFSLSWSNGYNGYTTYNLCVGDTVILTLGDGCDVELNIPYVFPQASQLSTNTGFSPACAASCNGTAYTFEYNGVTPYTYIWNTGGTDNDIINTCANTWYYVTVTDACDSIATDSVLVELAGPQVNSISTSTSVCALQCNGVATVNSSGGTPPFIYTWSNGSVGFGYYNDQVYNLCALDTYWVAILDPGCSVDTLTFSIPVNQVDIAVSSFVDNDCYYDCNGSIDVTVNGGSPPFGYSWSNGQTSPDIFDLCEDTFVLVVYDPGCSVDSMEVSIGGPEPTQATAQLLDTLNCQYDCLGSGVVIFEGGVPPFSVQWSNGSQDTLTQTLCYGDNFVIVDDPGCWSDTFLLNVSSFSHLAIEAALVSDALCYDSCNGAANVQAFNGVPPYAFAWANDETDDDAVALCAGLAYVTATDDVGCVAVDTVTVAQPPQMGMAAEVTPSHCENADGSASTAMSSGTPPFAFVWSNGATDAAIDGLLPGVYRVTVVDANGCPYYDSIAFDGLYPQLAVSNDTTILIGQPTHLFVSGATDYTWSPSPGLSCDTCEGPAVFTLESVEYCVIGVDPYGCADTACVNIHVSTACGAVAFPNAFTPNGDGLNDVFRPVGRCIFTYYMAVYNRWGAKVFESYDRNVAWDGTINGEPAEVGTYVYHAQVNTWLNEHVESQGNVTLLR